MELFWEQFYFILEILMLMFYDQGCQIRVFKVMKNDHCLKYF